MKREGYIYEKICNKDNIRQAIYSASRNKKHMFVVKRILNDVEKYVDKIYLMLCNKTFVPSPYIESIIKDGLNKKERIIHKPKFYPDQIIHWALINQIKHLMERGMYKWSCASISKRGQLYAKKRVQKWLRNDKRNSRWCFKLDIKKYYPSIDKNILKNKFRKIIKCDKTLSLIDLIVDSHDFGLPIGNYTSQWLANYYFQDIDHFVKEDIKVKNYIRYMDDLVLLDSNKRKIKKDYLKIEEVIKKHNLNVKNNYQLFSISKRSLDFVGFVFNHIKTFIRKRITKMCRRVILRI